MPAAVATEGAQNHLEEAVSKTDAMTRIGISKHRRKVGEEVVGVEQAEEMSGILGRLGMAGMATALTLQPQGMSGVAAERAGKIGISPSVAEALDVVVAKSSRKRLIGWVAVVDMMTVSRTWLLQG